PWAACRAVHGLRAVDQRERRAGGILLAFAALTAVEAIGYFIGYSKPAMWKEASATLAETIELIGGLLIACVGQSGRAHWPWSTLGLLVLGAPTLYLFARGLQKDRSTRWRLLGIAALAASLVVLGIGVELGRTGYGMTAVFAVRYVTV